ncbi:MAG: tetratricopeptide repeat protein [Quinella sp. 1Q5]|nr:tetratricopeptide repeat protein [Quinella sp. 1Q5]
MNRPASSKFVPGLPSDDDIDTPTNENASSKPDSIKIYDGIAECTMNDADTLKSVKLRAKDLAIQKVKQEIADYASGFWRDRYLTLPDDEVLSIADEICTITDVKYNVFDSDDNTLVRATVLAQVDDNVLMNYIIQFFKERNELKIQNETLRKENETLRNENSDLKRQISEFRQQVLNPLANKKSREADKLYSKEDYTGAIKLYDEAIRLNPNDDMSYNNRGLAYKNLRQYERALQDFNRAIQINPNNASAKYNRSQIHG